MSIQKQKEFIEYSVPDPPRIKKVIKYLNKNAIIKDNMRVLEIGYSRGGFIDNLEQNENIEKYAIDLFLRETSRGINFIKHDCNNGLPDFNFKFDIIFAGEVIEHIIDDEKFVENIYKLLNENGLFVLTTPNLFYLLNRFTFIFGKMPYFAYAPYHYHIYDIETISKIILKSGFRIKKTHSSHILYSTRRHKYSGKIFELLGDYFPSLGAHIILYAEK